MNKYFSSICAMLLLALTLTVGGVFAAFRYAQQPANPAHNTVESHLGEFVYVDYPPGFTKDLQSIVETATNDLTYGLNAENPSAGMNNAIVFSQYFYGRQNYGYVGTMDNYTFIANNVYGQTPNENVSIVLTFAHEVDGEQKILMYLVKKTKAQLTAMAVDSVLEHVYKATFTKNAEGKWHLARLPNGDFNVVKGKSPIKPYYDGQPDGAKTFGYFAAMPNASPSPDDPNPFGQQEIWFAD